MIRGVARRTWRQDTNHGLSKPMDREEKRDYEAEWKNSLARRTEFIKLAIGTSPVLPRWYYAMVKKTNGFRGGRPAFPILAPLVPTGMSLEKSANPSLPPFLKPETFSELFPTPFLLALTSAIRTQ